MDPNISARPMKPKLRLVEITSLLDKGSCVGCDAGPTKMCGKVHQVVPCVAHHPTDPLLHKFYHIKHLGDVPSTR